MRVLHGNCPTDVNLLVTYIRTHIYGVVCYIYSIENKMVYSLPKLHITNTFTVEFMAKQEINTYETKT